MDLLPKSAIRAFAGAFLVALALSGSGCSPGSLFGGNSQDSSVLQARTSRAVVPSCSEMDLHSSALDAPTFRSLVKCFNSQGDLTPVAKLTDRLSDAQLEPILKVVNQNLLGKYTRLYQVEATWAAWEAKALLDPAFAQIGRVLENDDLLMTGISVLKHGYFTSGGTADPRVLKSLELIAQELTPVNAGRGFNAGITLAESRAFGSLERELRGASPTGSDLHAIGSELSAYLQGRVANDSASAQKLLEVLGKNELLPALDPVLGLDEAALKRGIPRASVSLRALLENHARRMGPMAALFHDLKEPIACMEGSKVVPNAVEHLVQELSLAPSADPAAFIERHHLLTIVNTQPFCSFPPSLSKLYPQLEDFADTTAMGPTADLLKALYGATRIDRSGVLSRPLIELFVSFLGDESMPHLVPAMVELNERGAWDDLLLLAALPRLEDRASLASASAFLSEPQPALGGQSVFQALSVGLSRMSAGDLYDLLRGLSRLNDRENDPPFLAPALRTLRSAFYVNDVHPFIDLARDVLKDAGNNDAFFRTLFAASELPEFRPAIQHLAVMAKDGRLRSLLGDIVKLSHKFALQGVGPVNATDEPKFTPARRHDLASADLVAYPIAPVAPTVPSACRQVDLDVRLDQTTDPRYAQQLAAVLGCLDEGGRYADVEQAVNFLRAQKTAAGKDYLTLGIDFVRELKLDGEQAGYLTNGILRAINDGRAFRLLDALPFWVTHEFRDSAGESGPVLRPLLELARPWLSLAPSLEALRRLEIFAGQVLRRDDAAGNLKYLHYLWKQEPEPTPLPERPVLDPGTIAAAVVAGECRTSGVAERAAEVADEYQHAINNWELKNGAPRRSWEFGEFDAQLEPILQKFAEPYAGGSDGRHVYDAFLMFIRYFSLGAGERAERGRHYQPIDLLRWIQDRAGDEKLITWFYPGDPAPRVRVVNTLDRLEMILVANDYIAPWPLSKNFSLQFLGELADAWGDEPPALWPAEIRARYGNRKPPTLAQVVQHIESTLSEFEFLLGYPTLPSCLASHQVHGHVPVWATKLAIKDLRDMQVGLYNSRQVVSVLRENLPGSGTPADGGLRVLRDLFYEAKYATPADKRGPKDGADNHLTLILQKVRLGFLRQLGRQARRFAPADPALAGVFAGVVGLSSAPETSAAMGSLIVDDAQHTLIRKLVERLFGVIDAARPGSGQPELDLADLKQLSFYLLADLPRLGVADGVVKSLAAITARDRDFLLAHADSIDDILTSHKTALLTRALFEDRHEKHKDALGSLLRDTLADPAHGLDAMTLVKAIVNDPAAKAAWKSFQDRHQALTELPEYRALDLGAVGDSLLSVFEEGSATPAGRTALRMRTYLAERLEQGDLESFLWLARNNPQGFYQVLTTLAHYSGDGELKDFLNLLQRSIADPH